MEKSVAPSVIIKTFSCHQPSLVHTIINKKRLLLRISLRHTGKLYLKGHVHFQTLLHKRLKDQWEYGKAEIKHFCIAIFPK